MTRAPTGRGRTASRRLLDLLLPPACVCCGRGLETPEAPVCRLCWHRLPRIVPPFCSRCGASRPARIPGGCPECAIWPGRWRAAAACRMEGRARRLVHALKYGRWRKLAGPMGREMVPAARRLTAGAGCPAFGDGRGDPGPGRGPPAEEAGPPTLVPVPLSAARRRERGFNQAGLLAEGLSAATGWPVLEALARVRTGRRQARLGRRGRAENVTAMFRARRPGPGPGPVLLVDDVLTTGSTAEACLRTLGEAGTRPVGVVTFARALHSLGGPQPPGGS